MDKCPKCGAPPEDTSKFAFDSWTCESWHSQASDRFIESLKCCRRQLAAAQAKLEESARLATDSAKQADSLAKDLAAANERAGRLEEAERDELQARIDRALCKALDGMARMIGGA